MVDGELDLLVLGSGVAGLSAAVRAADTHKMRVGVLTKGELSQATTRWAQGGVAGAIGHGHGAGANAAAGSGGGRGHRGAPVRPSTTVCEVTRSRSR